MVEKVAPAKTASNIIDDFIEIVVDELEISTNRFNEQDREEVIEEIVGEVELVKHEVYPIVAKYYFQDIDRYEQLTYLTMVFCREQNLLDEKTGVNRGEEKADYREEIRNIVADFRFTKPREKERCFIQTYDVLKDAIRTGKRNSDRSLFRNDVDSPEKVYNEFAFTYIPLQHPDYDEESKTEREQLRSKVVRLVHDAELNTGAVSKDILKIIQQEEKRIREEFQKKQAYMVFSQTLAGEDTKEAFTNTLESKFPYHVNIGTKSYHTPEEGSETIFLTQHIVYPRSDYDDLEDFYERGISNFAPDKHFVAVMEIATSEYYIPEKPKRLREVADNPAYLDNNIEALAFLQTEHPPGDITSRAIDNLLGDEIEVKEMLKSLRIDVLIPNVTMVEQETIRRNRESIEAEFEISDVFDWRKKNPSEIASYIHSIDNESGNSLEEWKDRAEVLVKRAGDWHDAIETLER
jgi:hypothetical protein